jgi:NitT/TauT family transport system substrate-binding protein
MSNVGIKMYKWEQFGRRLFRYLSTTFAVLLTLTLASPLHAQVKWKHGVLQAKGDAGIFWMALEKGFFKEHGLDVEFVQFRGDVDLTRALLAGAVDSAGVSPAPMLNAIDRGADLRIIGASMPGYPYALYVRKDVTSWDQLKGKTFGVSSPGSVTDIMSRLMLARKGVDPESIKIVNAGGSGARIKALVAGKVDAAATSSEYAADADKLGIKVMAYAADLVPEYPRYVIFAKEATLKEKPEAAINFLAGYMQGLDYAMKHRTETLELTGKVNHKPASDPTFAQMYDEVIAKHYVSPNMEVPRAKIEWLQIQLLNAGALRKKIDLDKYIDDRYQQAALKRADLH